MEKTNDIPIKGKVYNFYDDGKITKQRQYKCTITNVIPSNKIGRTIKGELSYMVNHYYWIFADETDYYVFGNVEGDVIETQLFARTKDNGWFSIGIEYYGKEKQFEIKDSCLVGGRLDVTGELTDTLNEYNGEKDNTKMD